MFINIFNVFRFNIPHIAKVLIVYYLLLNEGTAINKLIKISSLINAYSTVYLKVL